VHADVREQILGLRIDVFPGRPMDEALREVVSLWRRYCPVAAELDVQPDLKLSPVAELQVLRIVQEALANVRKHSRAEKAHITLRELDGVVEVVVQDDGEGFDPASKYRVDRPRFGLAIMRERAESIGATFALESSPGEGTRVTVRVPAKGAAGENHASLDR
jgi:signal transduction histidine kinase